MSATTTAADELLSIPSCVILSVSEGAVCKVAAGDLRVLTVASPGGDTSGSAASTPLRMLICGTGFSYPLMGQPVLQSQPRTFILPATPTLHYVLNLPAATAASSILQFEQLIRNATQLRFQPGVTGSMASSNAVPPMAMPVDEACLLTTSVSVARPAAPAESNATVYGNMLAGGIVTSGRLLASGAVIAADYAGVGLRWGSQALVSYLSPAAAEVAQRGGATPSVDTASSTAAPSTIRNLPVTSQVESNAVMSKPLTGSAGDSSSTPAASPVSGDYAAARTALTAAKWVTGAAVTVSSALVAGAMAAGQVLGVSLSTMLRDTATGQSISSGLESDAGKAVSAVAVASLTAVAEVWEGLEKAAIIVGVHTSEATKLVVEHRYGLEAGVVAHQSMEVATDIAMTGFNMSRVTLGGVIKRTALAGAKNVIIDKTDVGGKRDPTDAIVAAGKAAVGAASASAVKSASGGAQQPKAGLLASAAFGTDTADLLAAMPRPPTEPVHPPIASAHVHSSSSSSSGSTQRAIPVAVLVSPAVAARK